MNSVELTDFCELMLTGDMRYLRFVDKNSNKLYLVEYYTNVPLEVTIDNLSKLNTIDEIKNYFKDAYIFEFIETHDLKHHLNTIKEMTPDEKKMLTLIVKEIKSLNISYINFANFFVETQDRKLYYAKIKKNGEVILKNLKIDMVIRPADIDVIIRDINAYGAFKYRNVTIKYEDIKPYIENPLLSSSEELSWVISKVREYESSRRVQEKIKEKKTEEKAIAEKKEIQKPLTIEKTESIETKPLDKLKDLSNVSENSLNTSYENKEGSVKKKKKAKKESKFKGSLMMYCLIGFTAGVLLAAITIVIGSFI